jgi:hypothetical protein
MKQLCFAEPPAPQVAALPMAPARSAKEIFDAAEDYKWDLSTYSGKNVPLLGLQGFLDPPVPPAIMNRLTNIEESLSRIGGALAILLDGQADSIDTAEAIRESIERMRRGKKKEVSPATRAKHVAFCRALQPMCMACTGKPAPLFGTTGKWCGEIHHAVNVSDASPKATMAICPDCNKRANKEPLPVSIFEHYQIRFQKWLQNPGPLFDA